MRFRLLAGIPEAEAKRLLAVARRRRFARGEVVFHRDDPADCLHLIAKGRFAVRVITPSGDTATVAVRGVGDNFGETALLASSPRRSATVSALEPAETFALDADELEHMRAAFPGVDKILFEVDYPHSDCVWPNSRTGLEEALRDVPDGEARLIAGDNARRLLRL